MKWRHSLMMAINGWNAWKSNAVGCICVLGERYRLEVVIHPLVDLELCSSWDVWVKVIVVLPEHEQW